MEQENNQQMHESIKQYLKNERILQAKKDKQAEIYLSDMYKIFNYAGRIAAISLFLFIARDKIASTVRSVHPDELLNDGKHAIERTVPIPNCSVVFDIKKPIDCKK